MSHTVARTTTDKNCFFQMLFQQREAINTIHIMARFVRMSTTDDTKVCVELPNGTGQRAPLQIFAAVIEAKEGKESPPDAELEDSPPDAPMVQD